MTIGFTYVQIKFCGVHAIKPLHEISFLLQIVENAVDLSHILLINLQQKIIERYGHSDLCGRLRSTAAVPG